MIEPKSERRVKPAEKLEGTVLPNGWTVRKPLALPDGHTGGFFSFGYLVEHQDGRRGYLKALDFFEPLYFASDPALELRDLTQAFVWERDLHERCEERNLSRVVRAVDHGAVRVDGFDDRILSTVQYLIFELAEGDVRSKLVELEEMGLEWALRCLHHAASGLNQLHSLGVAHQDLKPSNILLFEGGRSSKVGDLGRSTHEDVPSPHESAVVAGALEYAPPELLYRSPPSDWNVRRQGCDAYLLGSMIVFFFTGLSATALLMKHVPRELHHVRWGGQYTDVLPHLQQAFGEMLQYIEPNIPDPIRTSTISMIRELCDPDPFKRGDPRNRRLGRNPYSLERYISRLDLAARRAAISALR